LLLSGFVDRTDARWKWVAFLPEATPRAWAEKQRGFFDELVAAVHAEKYDFQFI
jgi:hypothetical protein